MSKYEPDDIVCLYGGCNDYYCAKKEGITSWMEQSQEKTRLCCKVCPSGKTCENRCNAYKKKCSSMEYFKNTENSDGNFWRKDNFKSEFEIKDTGIRWWIAHEEPFMSHQIRVLSDTFYSEKDARKWMETFTKSPKIYIIKGKLIETKVNSK